MHIVLLWYIVDSELITYFPQFILTNLFSKHNDLAKIFRNYIHGEINITLLEMAESLRANTYYCYVSNQIYFTKEPYTLQMWNISNAILQTVPPDATVHRSIMYVRSICAVMTSYEQWRH
jgi:hypothetical protein